METIKQNWQKINEWQKILITIIITIFLFSLFSDNNSSFLINVNKNNKPVIINPDTGKPVKANSCKPSSETSILKSITNNAPCQIFTEEYKQQEQVVINIHRKKGSTICCMTTFIGAEVEESCFTTPANLPRCPGPYIKQ